MKGAENLEMEPDHLSEENIYANMCDLDVRRMRNTSTAKVILAARSTKYRVILILGVLLILAFLVVVILISLLFIYYKSTQKEILQMKNDKDIKEEITQLKANYSALKKGISDLQKSAVNITDDLNKMKLIKNKDLKQVHTQQTTNSPSRTFHTRSFQPSSYTFSGRISPDIPWPNPTTQWHSQDSSFAPPTPPGSSNPLCSEGWRHYGLHCYYLSSDKKPWKASRKDCENMEAHLVVINSEEEMNFLRGIANEQSFWIGLTDPDGTWRWVDRTPYNITPKFWGKDQPDDWKDHNFKGGEKGEDCATLRDGYDWNDRHCSEKIKYICEKKMTF
ncbi:uncharacterized protein [Aquarana catesbeiana]|uniref:uncharacterized protein isoform X2 n=1 Tax=Aquarana catesbeiana TaxID=8400 RepID=UPI003CC99E6A